MHSVCACVCALPAARSTTTYTRRDISYAVRRHTWRTDRSACFYPCVCVRACVRARARVRHGYVALTTTITCTHARTHKSSHLKDHSSEKGRNLEKYREIRQSIWKKMKKNAAVVNGLDRFFPPPFWQPCEKAFFASKIIIAIHLVTPNCLCARIITFLIEDSARTHARKRTHTHTRARN